MKMPANCSEYNNYFKKYAKIVKNDEKGLEIIEVLLYNKHWACKNRPY